MRPSAALAAGLCAILWAGQAQANIYGCSAHLTGSEAGDVEALVSEAPTLTAATWRPRSKPEAGFLHLELRYALQDHQIGVPTNLEIGGEVPRVLRRRAMKGYLLLRLDDGREWRAPWDGAAQSGWDLTDQQKGRDFRYGRVGTGPYGALFGDGAGLLAAIPTAKRVSVLIEGADHRKYGATSYDLTPLAERDALFARAFPMAVTAFQNGGEHDALGSPVFCGG
jgi:hypothetical protein